MHEGQEEEEKKEKNLHVETPAEKKKKKKKDAHFTSYFNLLPNYLKQEKKKELIVADVILCVGRN